MSRYPYKFVLEKPFHRKKGVLIHWFLEKGKNQNKEEKGRTMNLQSEEKGEPCFCRLQGIRQRGQKRRKPGNRRKGRTMNLQSKRKTGEPCICLLQVRRKGRAIPLQSCREGRAIPLPTSVTIEVFLFAQIS